jgi:hypothetical protein
VKECFGQLGNTVIKWVERSGVHFISTDETKTNECRQCELFNQCTWEKTLALLREMLKMIDDQRPKRRSSIT